MKRALVTICIGEYYEKLAELTHPTLKSYADKIGADFIVWRGFEGHSHPAYQKIEIGVLLDSYDRVLYIDTDIIIREDSPNIFDEVPYDKLGLFEEGAFANRVGAMSQYSQQCNLDLSTWDGSYFNTGVIVCSKIHKDIFAPTAIEIINYYEQTYLNFRIHQINPEIHSLHHKWNRMSLMDTLTGESRLDSYFLHYAGVNKDLMFDLVKSDKNSWAKASPTYKFKRNIAIIVTGGLGDQITAEPVARYVAEQLYPKENVVIASHFPDLFRHISGAKSVHHKDPINDPGSYYKMNTLHNSDHPIWQYMSHILVQSTDWSSICAIRAQLPISQRSIKLQVNPEALLSVQNKVLELGFKRPLKDLVLIHPGRRWPSKTFPAHVWQSYVDLLTKDGFPVALIGKDLDTEQGVVSIPNTDKCFDLINKLNLDECIALISQARVLISNDSSPIHIAGAFDNWIGLIATSKNPDFIFPYRQGSQSYKTKALYKIPMWNDYSHAPTQVYGVTIDKVEQKRLLECLPTPDQVANFVLSTDFILKGK